MAFLFAAMPCWIGPASAGYNCAADTPPPNASTFLLNLPTAESTAIVRVQRHRGLVVVPLHGVDRDATDNETGSGRSGQIATPIFVRSERLSNAPTNAMTKSPR